MLTVIEDFYNKLKDHLLQRLLDREYSGDEESFTEVERDTVIVEHHRLYCHQVVRINHTTYDIRRKQDSIKCGNHSDIMLLAHEDETEQERHPFWYARIIGIYHASVRHTGPASKSDLPQLVLERSGLVRFLPFFQKPRPVELVRLQLFLKPDLNQLEAVTTGFKPVQTDSKPVSANKFFNSIANQNISKFKVMYIESKQY